MKQKLSIQNVVAMGFMVFAMFLGAGNLIFPPMSGQLSGEAMSFAAAGFLFTGVGLPLLGIIAIAKVGGGFNAIASGIPKGLIVALGSIMYLIMGPLYAVPRTALVSYEIAAVPFLPESSSLNQFIFSLVFFAISWYLSIYPGKLLESVGKLITPGLIALLLLLGIAPFLIPMAPPAAPVGDYAQTPFISGFLEGYLTMDALASLMFGTVIILNLKSHGITDKNSLFYYSITTGVIAATGLALVYISLFNLGATSTDIAPNATNGAQILTLFTQHLLGSAGTMVLAAVVAMACLTTAIGCITACSEYFDEMLGWVSYKTIVTVISLICVCFANMRLNEIIDLFEPALLFLYPIAIALIFLGLVRNLLPNPTLSYRATLSCAALFSIIDLLRKHNHELLVNALQPFSQLPGYDDHMLWVLPSLAVLLVTFLWGWIAKPIRKKNTSNG